MEPVSRLRLFLGWTLEVLLLFLQLIFVILPIPLPSFRRGRRGTIIIVTIANNISKIIIVITVISIAIAAMVTSIAIATIMVCQP